MQLWFYKHVSAQCSSFGERALVDALILRIKSMHSWHILLLNVFDILNFVYCVLQLQIQILMSVLCFPEHFFFILFSELKEKNTRMALLHNTR